MSIDFSLDIDSLKLDIFLLEVCKSIEFILFNKLFVQIILPKLFRIKLIIIKIVQLLDQ